MTTQITYPSTYAGIFFSPSGYSYFKGEDKKNSYVMLKISFGHKFTQISGLLYCKSTVENLRKFMFLFNYGPQLGF